MTFKVRIKIDLERVHASNRNFCIRHSSSLAFGEWVDPEDEQLSSHVQSFHFTVPKKTFKISI
jgi:hypothetical protein